MKRKSLNIPEAWKVTTGSKDTKAIAQIAKELKEKNTIQRKKGESAEMVALENLILILKELQNLKCDWENFSKSHVFNLKVPMITGNSS